MAIGRWPDGNVQNVPIDTPAVGRPSFRKHLQRWPKFAGQLFRPGHELPVRLHLSLLLGGSSGTYLAGLTLRQPPWRFLHPSSVAKAIRDCSPWRRYLATDIETL